MTEDFEQTQSLLMSQALANLHTSTVVKVMKVGSVLLEVKPVIARVVDGVVKPMPTLIKVPRLVYQGGSSFYSMPISVGDYGMLFITERCFDNWYAGTDDAKPREMRMHDYSDGFYYGGCNPESKLINITDRIHEVGDKLYEGDIEIQGNETMTGDRKQTGKITVTHVDATKYSAGGTAGATGSFDRVTVVNGLVTGGS